MEDVTRIYEDYVQMNPKQAIQEFEFMRNLAELKVLSKYSLENPLSDSRYNRMMELKMEIGL